MVEYSKEVLKQLFPIGTIVENNGYKEGLFKKLEKIYIMENLIGTQLYKIVAEKRDNENINRKRGQNMTNFEKYKDDLMKIEGEFAFNKNTREILKCDARIGCKDCIFNEWNCTGSDKIKWLCEEYEPHVLSDDELELIKVLSKATNKEYKYLAKQEGRIYLFTNKPFVHCGAFGNSYTSNRYFAYVSDKDETLFQNIENESGIYDIENKIFI